MKKNVITLFAMMIMASGLFAAPVAKTASRAALKNTATTTIAALPAAKQLAQAKASLMVKLVDDEPTTFIFATTCGTVVVIQSSGGMSNTEKLVYMVGFELAYCGE